MVWCTPSSCVSRDFLGSWMEKLRMAVDNTGAGTWTVVRNGDAEVERASRDSILSIDGELTVTEFTVRLDLVGGLVSNGLLVELVVTVARYTKQSLTVNSSLTSCWLDFASNCRAKWRIIMSLHQNATVY